MQKSTNVEDIYLLAPGQHSLLMYLLLENPRPETYFEQYLGSLTGDLDAELWRQAWQRVFERHPALRSHPLWEKVDRPLQVVRRGIELPWEEHDWRGMSEDEYEASVQDYLESDVERGFELHRAPLMRCALMRVTDDLYYFLWTFSHLLADGWSLALVLGEAQIIYLALQKGEEPALLPATPFRDWIAWADSQDMVSAEQFWRRELAGFDTPTPLPYDGTGCEVPEGERASVLQGKLLDAGLATALEELARSQRVTLSTVFQAAWSLLLAHLGGLSDVVYGLLFSGRPADLPGIDRMVGLCVNALPARTTVDPDERLVDWLQRLQEKQGELRQFEYVAGEQIRAWSELPRKVAVFESVLIFENYPVDGLSEKAAEVKLASRGIREAGNFPLVFVVNPQEGLTIRFLYLRERFSPEVIGELLRRTEIVLRSFVSAAQADAADGARVGDISLLAGAEERQALALAGVGPDAQRPPATLHGLIEAAARRFPDNIAVVAGERQMTYSELLARAYRLAVELRTHGVGPEVVVGLAVDRTPEMIVGLLGVLAAGGAYLPLDPGYPQDRLAFMIEDTRPRVLVVGPGGGDSLPPSDLPRIDLDASTPAPAAPPALEPSSASPENLAFVIYTSGSTGRPKGVGVPHSAAASYTLDSIEVYQVEPQDRLLQFAAISFDTAAEEIYPTLASGATLVLREREYTGFLPWLGKQEITVLNLPTAVWHDMARDLETSLEGPSLVEVPPSLRLVIIGGEAAQADRLAAWHRVVPESVRLVNTYGPTEATIVTTRADLTRPVPGPVLIGRAISNARAHVLDRRGEPLPALVDGELLLGGPGVTRGYLRRPALTAAAFVPDPFSGQGSTLPGARLYRSGDLARRRLHGELEYRGRIDGQVKVRGYRMELGEIESALRSLPGVADAVVTVRTVVANDDRLVAYWVPAEGADKPSHPQLREGLAERLPDYMVPAVFVELERLPRTQTGKIDRRALPAPAAERPDLASTYVAPRNPREEVLAGIWGELLGVEDLGVEDDFFELGGHSLLVAQLASRVRSALGIELPLTAVFDHPTVAGLAATFGEAPSEGAAPTLELPPLVPVPRDGRKIPLSMPQERIWFLDRLAGGSNKAYNFQVTLWFDGHFHVGAFHRTLEEIVRRHEVLRSSFPEVDGEPVQRIHPPAPVALPVIDLSGLTEVVRGKLSEALVFHVTQIPFHLAQAPLIRWYLLRLEALRHELIQVEQHFVHDGWSFSVMVKEMKAIYGAYLRGEPSPLPELPVQYADYTLWQRQCLQGETLERMLGFWLEKLAGAPHVLDLPTDRPRPEVPTFAGSLSLHLVPPKLYDDMRQFSRREGFTLFMTSLAAFFVLMYRYSGQDDMLVGTSNANRRAVELEGMIGMIVNTLVLRGDLTGNPTFRELLGRVREMTLGAWAHQDMPLERIVQALEPERQAGRNPLFQTMFQFHDAAMPDFNFPGGLETKFLVRGNRSAKMDLTVILIPRAEQRVGMGDSAEEMKAFLQWEHSTDLFDQSTAERMIGHFMRLLESTISDPDLRLSELPMLSSAEMRQLELWNGERHSEPPPWTTVAQAFAEQAARTPEAPAVAMAGAEDEAWSYAELERRSGQLAGRLAELGVTAETLVALSLTRSPWMVAALLAVARTGAAYLPLDPDFPRDRLAFMLADSGAALLVTEEALLGRLGEGVEKDRPLVVIDRTAASQVGGPPAPVAAAPQADNLAYVLYTSGSTGVPKGVEVPYGALANFLSAMARQPGFAASDTLLAVTTLSFDIAGLELYLPLVTGGRLVIADAETAASGSRLAAAIDSSGATVMQATPATWRMLLDAGARLPARLRVLAGGEALPPALVGQLAQASESSPEPGLELWNLYGPTETTVWSALDRVDVAEVAAQGKVAIGRPIDNTGLYLASEHWELAPIGVSGQLLIGGHGLARGYHCRPALTAERFRPDPFSRQPGQRLYCTGDLARRREDGRLDFMGRIDHQVKVRGFRIELGEVEAALLRHEEVAQAVVVARRDAAGGGDTLIAYVVPARVGADGSGSDAVAADAVAAGPDAAALVEHLRRSLPSYMVPSAFLALSELPLTPNGKVDRKALPEPGGVLPLARAQYLAPRTPLEEHLVALWTAVLGVEPIGVQDSFFVLGGHSLAAGRVLARVRDRLGVELPLSVMFDTPTVEALASAVEAAGGSLDGADQQIQAKAAALSDDELDALLGEMLTEKGVR